MSFFFGPSISDRANEVLSRVSLVISQANSPQKLI
jgi:hypothetical protein